MAVICLIAISETCESDRVLLDQVNLHTRHTNLPGYLDKPFFSIRTKLHLPRGINNCPEGIYNPDLQRR